MYQVTVGQISGAIAAVVALVQFILPNALILVLVGVLKDTHSAVTWSVVGNALSTSNWPLVLGSDATSSRSVDPRVRWVTWIRPLGLGLVFIAAILTPLGLYETIEMDDDAQLAGFEYVGDDGPMGYGTPPRSNNRFSRICSIGPGLAQLPLQCPGTTTQINYSINAEWSNASWDGQIDPRIPDFLVSLYQSGLDTQPKTVSSFFDIQSRQYNYQTQRGVLNDKNYLVSGYRPLTLLALNDDFEAVEGLVVDTRNGGVGMRNHTAPIGLQYGAEWNESILFLEPETACVDTNITMEFKIPDSLADVEYFHLVDNGGFVNINKSYHEQHFWEENNQLRPQLMERAYGSAWRFNAYNMLYMNITRPWPDQFGYLNSKMGQRFLFDVNLSPHAKFDQIQITDDYSSVVNAPLAYLNGTILPQYAPSYLNPWNISEANYSTINDYCSSSLGGDYSNITNIGVQCGLVFGAARRKDGGESLIFAVGTPMVQSMYTCASVTKAVIKDVHFRYNTSSATGLDGLQIVNISDKVYANEAEMPLWAVESPYNYSLSELNQLWGLISPSLSPHQRPNASTVRSPRLYLPTAYWSFLGSVTSADYTVGTQAPGNAWSGVYDVPTSIGADYSGADNFAMFVRWRNLSNGGVTTTAKMLNLIWTDIMASSVVGTRSWTSGDTYPWDPEWASEPTRALVPVYVYNRRIRYNWLYAIPAFLCLIVVAGVLLAATFFGIQGRGTRARVRHFVAHLSAGRILGALLFPEETDVQAGTSEWIAAVGRRKVTILTDGRGGFVDGEMDGKERSGSGSGSSGEDVGIVQVRGKDGGIVTEEEEEKGSGSTSLDGEGKVVEQAPSKRGGYVRAARSEEEV